ncbi:efflux RND transporter periplasmic adaptor subunit [Paenibacillus sp. LMG 31460]|uniref:Efflux RND transporter periplasmic adaptor subunit n=1 Tax=Paenibacillus germinis TaxID=2654979 RepID=A0ABX1Z653_9BACL|nr:efflux RND transporter periplasmic adaptor subunit [Paenibacillus germinis]NOU88762.1 efflux RND transporter periplasmic adaptor subunit [Paenibacillus germinis]
MNVRVVERVESNPKRKIKLVFILCIAALLILTLYSNTLLTMNLPKVWAEEGRTDPLSLNYSGSGDLQPLSEVELSNKAGWMVKDVQVKAGEHVTKGQTLVTYDSKEAESRIQDEEVNLSRQKLMMEGLQERYIAAEKSGDELTISSAKREIDIARLEMGAQERKIRNLQEDLERFRQVVAPYDGVVTKVAAVKDMPSGSAGRDVIVSNSSLGFQLALPMPASIADLLELGSKQNVEVKIKGVIQSLEGVVTGIEPAEAGHTTAPAGDGGDSNTSKPKSQKRVLVTVQSAELQGGEQATMKFSKSTSVGNGVLLPNKAIHGEIANKYIFVIEEKKSPLGNTYHASKVAIEVGEANEDSVIVLKGAYSGQQIIVESSEPLQDGSRVRKR